MDGIVGIRARIASLEQRFAPRSASPSERSASGFEVVLDRATNRTSTVPNVASSTVPVDLPADPKTLGHNGELPASALVAIGVGHHRLAAAAAEAFRAMRADAMGSGVNIGVTDSYRTLDQQVDLAKRKGLYSNGGLAAAPGTSDHGWGLSVDVDVNEVGQRWLRSNASSYGFSENVPREPWHWTFGVGDHTRRAAPMQSDAISARLDRLARPAANQTERTTSGVAETTAPNAR